MQFEMEMLSLKRELGANDAKILELSCRVDEVAYESYNLSMRASSVEFQLRDAN